MAKPSVWIGLWPSARDARLLAVSGGTAADRLHLTLVYIPCTEEQVADIGVTARRLGDRVAAGYAPVRAKLGAVRTFPGRVHYIGVREDGGVLVEMREHLDYMLAANRIGIARSLDFVPHVTLRVGERPVRHHRQRNITFDALRVIAGDAVAIFPLTGLTSAALPF